MASKLRTTIPESEARFVRSDADEAVTHATSDANSRTMWREWTQIKASVAKSLSNTLMGVAQITGPTVDGETYTGVYSNADVIVIENNRRWVTIRQKLIRLTTVAGATSVIAAATLPQPVNSQRVEVYRSFQYNPGSGDTVVQEYRYLDRSSRGVCEISIADADLELSGYTIEARRWGTEPRGDRTCTFYVFQRKVTWTNVNSETSLPVSVRTMGEDSYFAGVNFHDYMRVDHQTAFGVPIDSAQGMLNAWRSAEDRDGTGIATKNVTVLQRADGEVFMSRDIEVVNTNTSLSAAFVVERDMDISSGLPKRAVVVIPNLTKETSDALLTTLSNKAILDIDNTAYRNSGVRRKIHDSGLSDLFIIGKMAGTGSTVGNNSAVGDIYNFKQEIRTSDEGVVWRVIFGRRVTTSEQSAVNWANDSSDRPLLNNLKAHKGGRIDYLSNLGLWVAMRETWLTITSNDATDGYLNTYAVILPDNPVIP